MRKVLLLCVAAVALALTASALEQGGAPEECVRICAHSKTGIPFPCVIP